MEAIERTLLDVWHLVGSHGNLDDCLGDILPLLAAQMPVDHILVRKIDTENGRLETLAEASLSKTKSVFSAWSTLCGQTREALAEMVGSGRVWDGSPNLLLDGSHDALAGYPILAVPLDCPQTYRGVFILLGRSGAVFSERDRFLAGALRDPLTAAFGGHLRTHEILAHQNAAEAERLKLLHRLGRAATKESIVGEHGGLRTVMERVRMISQNDAPVLILGETGSGKEVVAREIHNRSLRKGNAFLRVNCGAIAPELIDSELFGHERGAFTGATSIRRGWFERADGGTLFLDEVGELTPAAQVRLLRVLQDGWLERVGGEHSIHVNVRIVAATHCDLAGMIAQKRFREDLWYRLSVFPIFLPPLRDRLEDIPEMATFFAARASQRFGMRHIVPSPQDIALLRDYSWPGNVREFSAVIDRAAILGNGERLEIAKALGATAPLERREKCEPESAGAGTSTLLTLDMAVKRHIEQALTLTRGVVEGAQGCARLLGVNPHTLRGKMRKLGIDWARFRSDK